MLHGTLWESIVSVVSLISNQSVTNMSRSECRGAARRSRKDRFGTRSSKSGTSVWRWIPSERRRTAPFALFGKMFSFLAFDANRPKNLLRKAFKWNYDYYSEQGKGAFKDGEDIVRIHVTHCLDILRQQLMCVTDVGVLGQVWWQPEGELGAVPFVDFNTKHRCRDFEAIRKWAEVHQLPPEELVDMSAFYQMPRPGDTVYGAIP